MKQQKLISSASFLFGILTLITLIITWNNIHLGLKTFVDGGFQYTHYNNYIIFKKSFFHLLQNKDLYQLYPAEQWDLYKYSPTFSLLMAPMAVLPDILGLFIWNIINAAVLFFALWKLPYLTTRYRLLTLIFILIELITSMQNSQCNALIAGLIIFAFIQLEKKHIALASLFVVLTVFIKLFGVVAFALFLFYPNKPQMVIYTIGWIFLLSVLPLLVISMSQLLFLYSSWWNLLQNDFSASYGFSVAGLLHSWFHCDLKNAVTLGGMILFCLPFLKYKYFNQLHFKLFFLSSILIWIVIFNHKAESPTFIIAVSGIAIWFFSQKLKIENLILLIAAILLTILSPTDIFPKTIRDNYVIPYVLKVFPCILIWLKIIIDLMLYKKETYINTIGVNQDEFENSMG